MNREVDGQANFVNLDRHAALVCLKLVAMSREGGGG